MRDAEKVSNLHQSPNAWGRVRRKRSYGFMLRSRVIKYFDDYVGRFSLPVHLEARRWDKMAHACANTFYCF